MFVRSIVIPALAVAGVCVAVWTVLRQNQPITPAQPVAQPASPPYADRVAGAGLVEASSQNIAIGTQLPGVVTSVPVKAGDRVKAGTILFTLDDRALQAELKVRIAALDIAQRTLDKLRAQPRPEEVPPVKARVDEMSAMVGDMANQLRIMEGVTDPGAVSQDDLSKRRFALQAARARLSAAEAELRMMEAGAWAPDIAIAQAQVDSARAQVESVRTDLDRLSVRAPTDGTVMQVNVRVGEYAAAGALSTPLMLFGDCDLMHVRVDIDENDAWRVKPGAPAMAYVRGNASISTPLTFVRVEPYVVPKKSLTGDSVERVDTRVLQVLYRFSPAGLPVYVGQQMDVYIDAPRGTASPGADGAATVGNQGA